MVPYTVPRSYGRVGTGLAHDIRPSVEVMPFAQAPEAYERMLSGKARFRVVLDVTAA
jgi:propanol-preferring alcohol dehydrogenase